MANMVPDKEVREVTVIWKGIPIRVIVRKGPVRVGGKEFQETMLECFGAYTYIDRDGDEHPCKYATYTYFGPKLGGGWNYTQTKVITAEENAFARKRVIEVATRAMIDQGIW